MIGSFTAFPLHLRILGTTEIQVEPSTFGGWLFLSCSRVRQFTTILGSMYGDAASAGRFG